MIYINGYFLRSDPSSGVYRFAFNMLLAIDEIVDNDVVNIVLLAPNGIFEIPKFKNIKIRRLKWLNYKYFWEQIILPLSVRDGFLINLANFAPIFKKNQLCVIHDTLVFRYPQAYSKKFEILTKFFHRQIVKHSKFIATVSQFSAKEILNIIGQTKNEIIVLGNSAEHMELLATEPQILQKFNLKPQRYIFSVFSQKNSQYKNVDWYLQAIAKFDYQFVCVGNVDFDGAVIPNNLIQLGYVSDQQLKRLYQYALGLLFPSLYEGFGIPPLEAMTCGCPVVVSDIPVLHEVCGDAALYFDPHDVNSLNDAINQLSDDMLRQDLIEKGFRRTKLFSWQESAKQLLNLIESSVLNEK